MNNIINNNKFGTDICLPNVPFKTTEINYNSFLFGVCINNQIEYISGRLNTPTKNIFTILNDNILREKYYVKAIDNLIKKNNFLQLSIEFDQEMISEEEFDYELEKNEDKYLIRIEEHFSPQDFKHVIEILHRLDSTLTSDQVAEIFSIPFDKVNNEIDYQVKSIK